MVKAWRPRLALVAVLLVAVGAGGCGGGSDEDPPVAHPSSAWQAPDKAAEGFGDYLAAASGKRCGQIAPYLPAGSEVGTFAPDLIAAYSCRNVMTRDEYTRECARNIVRPELGSSDPVSLSEQPRRLRYSVAWTGHTNCQHAVGLPDYYEEKGTYDVTVEEGSGGWMIVGFSITAGPGAGHSGGVQPSR